MDRLEHALLAIGGFAVIGMFIDFLLYDREQRPLKRLMWKWWRLFRGLRFEHLGLKEELLVLEFIDRTLGPKFYSAQRLKSVGLIVALTAALVGPYLVVLQFLVEPDPQGDDFGDAIRSLLSFSFLAGLAATFVVTNVALSVNRWLAVFAIKLSISPVATAVTFACMLLLQVILFVLWTDVVTFLVVMANMIKVPSIEDSIDVLSFFFEASYRKLIALFSGRAAFPISPLLLCSDPDISLQRRVVCETKVVIDLGIYGGRIAFALIFVVSFVLRPIIQRPLLRIWRRFLETAWPMPFTKLFGAIGTIYTFTKALFG